MEIEEAGKKLTPLHIQMMRLKKSALDQGMIVFLPPNYIDGYVAGAGTIFGYPCEIALVDEPILGYRLSGLS